MSAIAKRSGELGEPVGAAGHQDDAVAAAGQLARDGVTDSGRGAGDEGGPIVGRWRQHTEP